MRALITPGAAFSVDTPEEMFQGAWIHSPGIYPRTNWDVHPDGESYLFVSQPGAEQAEEGPVMRVLFQNSADARIESLQGVRMTSAFRSRSAR